MSKKKYILYLVNSDQYLSRTLGVFDCESVVQGLVRKYDELCEKFYDANNYHHSYMTHKNLNMCFSDFEELYWNSFREVGIDLWLFDNCDEHLYKIFKDVNCDLKKLVRQDFELGYDEALEM